jgi:hypothetical protein
MRAEIIVINFQTQIKDTNFCTSKMQNYFVTCYFLLRYSSIPPSLINQVAQVLLCYETVTSIRNLQFFEKIGRKGI